MPRLHSTRKLPSAQEDAAACAVLVLLTVGLFWPQVGQGRVLFWGDIGLYFLPQTTFLHDALARGRMPLWNPYILCGTPYIGNPQTSPLYPFSLLMPSTSAAQFINFSIAFHTALAACGTFLFLRRGQSRTLWAALLGAVTFAFGGQFVSKEQFPNMLAAMAYLPFALLCVQRLAQNLNTGDALALGVVLGLQLLAAHAQVSLLTLYLCAAYFISYAFRLRGGPPALLPAVEALRTGPILGSSERRRVTRARVGEHSPPRLGGSGGPFSRLVLAGCVAAGLSAALWLPTAAMLRDAWRQRLSFAVVDRFYLPPNQLGNWILPTLHGSPALGNFTARGNFWETCCYVGLVPFALAIWGAWHGRRNLRFWVGAFVIGTWLAMGGAGGLYHLAYWILPGVRAFHDPARCLLIAAFALACLTARGLDAVRFSLKPGVPHAIACAVVLGLTFCDLVYFDRDIYPTLPPTALTVRGPILSTVLADPDVQNGQARTLSPDTARVWQRFTGHRSYRADVPNYWPLWTDTLTPNLPMRNGVRDAFGYEPVARRDAQIVTVQAVNALRGEHGTAAREASLLSVKYAVLVRSVPPKVAGWRVVQSEPTLPPMGKQDTDRVYLLLNEQWQPRARVQSGTAQIVQDTPDTVTIDTDCARPSQLTLADTLAPGWAAQLDGHSVPIAQAHGLLRTVALPAAGRHTVTFSYRPEPFQLGLYVSLVTLAGLAGWGASKPVQKLMQKIVRRGKENAPAVSNLAN